MSNSSVVPYPTSMFVAALKVLVEPSMRAFSGGSGTTTPQWQAKQVRRGRSESHQQGQASKPHSHQRSNSDYSLGATQSHARAPKGSKSFQSREATSDRSRVVPNVQVEGETYQSSVLSHKARRQLSHGLERVVAVAKGDQSLVFSKSLVCPVVTATAMVVGGPLTAAGAALACLSATDAYPPVHSCAHTYPIYKDTKYSLEHPVNLRDIFSDTPLEIGNCYAMVLNALFREGVILDTHVQAFASKVIQYSDLVQGYNQNLYEFFGQLGKMTHYDSPEACQSAIQAGRHPSGSVFGVVDNHNIILHIGRLCEYTTPGQLVVEHLAAIPELKLSGYLLTTDQDFMASFVRGQQFIHGGSAFVLDVRSGVYDLCLG